MKVQLLVSEWCKPCEKAEAVWRAVAEERAIAFEVLDVGQPEGRAVVARLNSKTIPAVVIDGRLAGLGVQTHEQALKLVESAPPRPRTATRHVGISLETSSRAAILAAAFYLVVAGTLALPAGGIVGDALWRLAAIHTFTLGFVAFMIYGLGEHLLPRFTGNPIRLGAWSWSQQALAHAGLIGFAVGAVFGAESLRLAGAITSWLALALFAGRVLPVLWPDLSRRG